MLSLSSLIEFLLDMLRDEQTQSDFARDPHAALAARGLGDVTAQDVRDVQPMLADLGGVERAGGHAEPARLFAGSHGAAHGPDHGDWHPSGHAPPAHAPAPHDVVREIHQVTHDYTVVRPVTQHVTHEYKAYNSYTEFTDNSVHASDGSTVVQNSFNQDNDGVDNKGGVITDGSTVAGHDMGQSGNDTTTTTVEGSGNDSHAVTETGSENVAVDQDLHDVGNDGGDHDSGDSDHHTITYDEPYGAPGGDSAGDHSYADGAVNGSYDVDAPTASLPADDAASVGAEHHS